MPSSEQKQSVNHRIASILSEIVWRFQPFMLSLHGNKPKEDDII